MDRIRAFLTVLCAAGCGSGGGGSAGGDDAAVGDDAGMGGQDSSHDASHDSMVDASPQPAANDRCANATSISISTMHAVVAATTIGAHADLAAPCAAAGTPDVFFKFTLTRREMVYADTFGASSNTTLFFATSCTTARTAPTTSGDALCSSGACGTGQSQVAALLEPGTHYLVLAGQGAATIHFQHAEVGAGTVEHLAPGSSTPTGTTTSGGGGLFTCDAGGGENAYWWQTCPADVGGAFHASTCIGTAFDTMLSFQVPGSELAPLCEEDDVGCPDQTRSTMNTTVPAGAGLFVLAVDGNSTATYGSYTLSASRP